MLNNRIMKQKLYIGLMLCPILVVAQSTNWAWARNANGDNQNYAYAAAADAAGNVYVTGAFSGNMILGSYTLSSNGAQDMFIAKYDGAGNLGWAISAGGSFNDSGFGISTFSNSCFVTGYYGSSSISFGTYTLTNSGNLTDDFFIVKLDGAGNALWAKSGSGSENEATRGLSCDANGNTYLAGYFWSDTLAIGSNTLINVSSSVGFSDLFIVKYDPSGNVLWAKSAGGSNGDLAMSVSADKTSGDAYIAGNFNNSMAFGSTTLTSNGTSDFFIAKYSSSGNELWAKSAGNAGTEQGMNVSSDHNGNVVVTGNFYSPSVTFSTTVLNNAGTGADVFIAKYSSLGNLIWAKSVGSGGNETVSSIGCDINGNSFIAGNFTSASVAFGSSTLTNTDFSASDIFVARYNSSGNVDWALSAGGIPHDYASGLSVEGNAVFVCGYFSSPALALGSTTLTNTGNNFDFYAAKLVSSIGMDEELKEDAFFSVYPNPSRGSIRISTGEKNARVEIKNIIGETLYSDQNGLQEIDLTQFAKGIYFVKAYCRDGVFTRKIILE